MHGFVVTSKIQTTALNVCEAVGKGIVSAEIKFGDTDWTSMVLFVPKDANVAEQLVTNSMQELKSDEKGKVANYGFLEGIQSIFTLKSFATNQMSTVASEMADLIKFMSIKDETRGPKNCICSQLVCRILRSSTLMASIPKEKMAQYQLLDHAELRKTLVKEILKPDSDLNKLYHSSLLFSVPPKIETLPYELYLLLKKESNLH